MTLVARAAARIKAHFPERMPLQNAPIPCSRHFGQVTSAVVACLYTPGAACAIL